MSFIWYCYEKTYQFHPPYNIITNMKFTVRKVAVLYPITLGDYPTCVH